MANLDQPKTVWKLRENSELRLEVKPKELALLLLRNGEAEVFGTELQVGEVLTLRGQKLAVYSYRGCTLELSAPSGTVGDVVDSAYEADETPQNQYLSMHLVFQARRSYAQTEGVQGPRIMVVGPTDVGKSSLCKMLLNYAVREGACPTMVELDIGQNGVTAPGSICATPVEGPIDIEDGLPAEIPIVFYYGHTTPEANPEHYKYIVERLAGLLDRRSQANAEVRSDGMVINTMGWIEGLGYKLLLHSIKALKVDVIMVVGQDRLLNQLKSEFRGHKEIELVKVARSEGVVTRSSQFRKDTRLNRCREYFYGPRGTLMPHSQTARFHELKFYRIGGGPRAPSSALPIGATSVMDPLKLTELRISRDLAQTLVAVSHAESPKELLNTNIAGFLYITSVDMVQNTITYLAPSPGELPGRFILVGTLKVFLE